MTFFNSKKKGLMTKFSGVFFFQFGYYFIILIYILFIKGIKVLQGNTQIFVRLNKNKKILKFVNKFLIKIKLNNS